MDQYISKSALVAEIESLRRISFTNFNEGVNATVETLLSFIDTLEVKEVNLEEELENWLGERIGKWTGKECENMCRYFFELGLSVNNPITAADRGIVDEIIFALNALGEEKMISYDKEKEWLRNKVKKEEKYDTARNSR